MVSMATYLSSFVKTFYIILHNLKTIQSIFMKFLGLIDMDLSYTYNYIVTTDINWYGFYGNILIMLCQNILHDLT